MDPVEVSDSCEACEEPLDIANVSEKLEEATQKLSSAATAC